MIIYIIAILCFLSAAASLLWVALGDPIQVEFSPLKILRYSISAQDMDKIVYHVRIIHDRLARETGPTESAGIKPYRALDVFNEDPNMQRSADMELPILIGKDADQKLHYADLAKLPHVLIAGLTSFGKSMCFQNFIFWLGKSQNKVDVHAIDPKQTGFTRFVFSKKPVINVISKEEEYANKLDQLVEEMYTRNALMRRLSFKDIGDYNEHMETKLHYIVLMIDEFQDLARKQQDGLKKLARMGRSAGIHLVLGTQNPNGVDIDPTILQQLAGVISFRLRNQSAAKRILGEGGAEQLKEKGEMMFKCATDHFKGRSPLAELKDFEFYKDYKEAQKAAIDEFLDEKKEITTQRGRPRKDLV